MIFLNTCIINKGRFFSVLLSVLLLVNIRSEASVFFAEKASNDFSGLLAGNNNVSSVSPKGINTTKGIACVPSTSQVPTSGLQMYLPFNNNMNDASPSGNHALPQGGPVTATDRLGQLNSCYNFNGTQFAGTSIQINNPNTFTIGLWFKTVSTTGGGLMGFGDNALATSPTNRDRVIYMNNSGQVEFGVYNGSIVSIHTNETYNDGVWHFAVATLSSNGMKLFIDGVLKASNASVTAGQNYSGYWRLAQFDLSNGWSTATSNYFTGQLDDVYYYNRELSLSEIQTLYQNANGAGSDSPKCAGETLSLTAVSLSGASYSWSGPNGFTSNQQNPVIPNISSANAGLYYVMITDGSGCTTTAPGLPVLVRVATVSVNISQAPTTGLITKYTFSGSTFDVSGNSNTGILQGSPAISSDRYGNPNAAYTLNGSSQYIATTTSFVNPSLYTIGLWFKTSSSSGGKLIGFGNNQTGTSTVYDRHIYMTNSGQIVYGVNSGGIIKTISTPAGDAYNDGQWHCVAATLSSAGIKLYIDGDLAASDASVTTAQNYTGYWRVGYDDIQNTWPSAPTSKFFNGSIDDVYIYSTELSSSVIAAYKSADGAGSNEPLCGTGTTLNLMASTVTGNYFWSGPNGFVSTAQNPSIASATAANTGVYTLTVTNTSSSCPAKAYVNVRMDTPPSAPTTSSATACDNASVTLTASGATRYRWYSTAAGGSVLLRGPSYTTPVVSTTTSYYVAAVSSLGCESTRSTATVTITATPASPTASADSVCGSGMVTLTASGTASTYNWYTGSSGGSAVASGVTYKPTISATTTFYVSSINNPGGCESGRTPVIAKVNPIPADPSASNDSTCGPGTVTLKVTPVGGMSYNWYTASTGGTSLASGTSYSPSVSSTTNYYVSAVNNVSNCVSTNRSLAIAKVNPIPGNAVTADDSTCGPGTVTLRVTPVAGMTYKWYAASTGGSSLASGTTYSPTVSSTTTYFVSVTDNVTNCTSAGRTSATAKLNSIPADAVAANDSTCGPGTVTLKVTSVAGITYKWYAASTGGTSLATGSTYSPSVSSTTTYYVSAINSISNCVSVNRSPAVAKVNPIPADPSASNDSTCGPGTVTLKVTPVGGMSYNWYTASTGGTSLASGTSYSPSVSSTTNYYVSAVNNVSNCVSTNRSLAIAKVNPIPGNAVTADDSTCGPGTVTLRVTPVAGMTYKWYAASTGGSSLASGTTYSPTVSSTTTYFVSVTDNVTNCTSAGRTSATAKLNSIPADAVAANDSTCGPGTVTLKVTSVAGITYKWYAASTGGTSLATGSTYSPSVSSTTTYYVSAINSISSCVSVNRSPAIAKVNPIPGNPVAFNDSTCGPGTVTLKVTQVTGMVYNWYTASTGGTPVASGATYSPSVSVTTNYYVAAINNTSMCVSAGRSTAIARVNPVPADPAAFNDSTCGVGTVTLKVTPVAGMIYKWYAAATGGTALITGSTYSPAVSSTTNYYVAAVDNTSKCVSANRSAAIAKVNSIPGNPATLNDSTCGAGTVTLKVNPVAGMVYNWYTASTGGAPVGTGSTYSPAISSTTNFYVAAVNNTSKCVSASRTIAVAKVNAIPGDPITLNDSTCGPGLVTLKVTPSAGRIYNWYSASTGGTPIASGASFSVSVSNTTSYFVSAVNDTSTCISANRSVAVAKVNPVPGNPATLNDSTCGPGMVTLKVTTVAGMVYNWYSASTGGTPVSTGATYSVSVSSTTNYYVSAINNTSKCVSTTRGTAIATVNPIPANAVAAGDSTCGAGTVTLKVVPSVSTIYNWYTSGSGGSPVSTGTTYTPNVSSTTTFYVAAVGNPSNCVSISRTPAIARVNPVPGDPAVIGDSVCGSGAVVLKVSPVAGTVYNWYTVSTGGSPVATGTSYSPVVTGTTTYYVSAISNPANCVSTGRTAVIAKVNSIPGDAVAIGDSVCGSGTVTLKVNPVAGMVYNWYTASAGGNPIASGATYSPTVGNTTVYYVSAVSTPYDCPSNNRTSVTAKVNFYPAMPQAKGDTVCVSGTVDLVASGATGKYKWYSAAAGGSPLAASATFSPAINADTVFYVSSDNNGCEGQRAAVIAKVSPLSIGKFLSVTGQVPACKGGNNGTLSLNGYRGSIIKWEVSTDSFSTVIPVGTTSDNYTYNDIVNTSYYRVIVKSGVCPADTSNNVTVSVDNSPLVNPGIVTSDTTVMVHYNSGTLNLSGYTGMIVSWESSTDLVKWYPTGVEPDAQFSYDSLLVTTYYRAVVRSGVCPAKNSNYITVKVLKPANQDTIHTWVNRDYKSGLSLLANDYFLNKFIISPVVSQPTQKGGSITIDSKGNVTYRPPLDYVGKDTFYYSDCAIDLPQLCFESALLIEIKDTVIVYTALTPNGDGLNDSWVIDGITSYPENNVKIFNRWGDVVYQERNYNNKDRIWRGDCNSGLVIGDRNLPEGTYFYSIELGNGNKPLTGYVVVKK